MKGFILSFSMRFLNLDFINNYETNYNIVLYDIDIVTYHNLKIDDHIELGIFSSIKI